MKALITGGAGFIGSHLAEALCRQGVEVVVLDDLSGGTLDNLAWRRAGDALEFVQGSVHDTPTLQRALHGCDWVFHHAAVVSVPLSVDDPEHTHHVNLTATVQLLRQARASGVKRFLLASSSAIYGDSEVLPKHERMPPLPRSPYALQKYASEQYAQLFHALYGLETVSFRYFNVFGPRQSAQSPYSGVIARFCTALLGDQTPRIFGDGQQTRDFVFVSDVVAANLLAATAPAAEVAGRVFNVASGQSVTLLKLLEELAHLTGRRVQPCFEPARAGDVRHSAADLSALREAVGFAPGVTLREGLRATLAFYREADGRMGNDAI